ncbi:hypothetical protein BHE74_00004956 [Ensete ventricosum]|nr:hypothetical protein GW17_00014530 [Ensete ventricosum]RWW86273.1 hypothetical protein BHE74_00004956 [Ensete ventricosum]
MEPHRRRLRIRRPRSRGTSVPPNLHAFFVSHVTPHPPRDLRKLSPSRPCFPSTTEDFSLPLFDLSAGWLSSFFVSLADLCAALAYPQGLEGRKKMGVVRTSKPSRTRHPVSGPRLKNSTPSEPAVTVSQRLVQPFWAPAAQ